MWPIPVPEKTSDSYTCYLVALLLPHGPSQVASKETEELMSEKISPLFRIGPTSEMHVRWRADEHDLSASWALLVTDYETPSSRLDDAAAAIDELNGRLHELGGEVVMDHRSFRCGDAGSVLGMLLVAMDGDGCGPDVSQQRMDLVMEAHDLVSSGLRPHGVEEVISAAGPSGTELANRMEKVAFAPSLQEAHEAAHELCLFPVHGPAWRVRSVSVCPRGSFESITRVWYHDPRIVEEVLQAGYPGMPSDEYRRWQLALHLLRGGMAPEFVPEAVADLVSDET